jgi:hypothetical protein
VFFSIPYLPAKILGEDHFVTALSFVYSFFALVLPFIRLLSYDDISEEAYSRLLKIFALSYCIYILFMLKLYIDKKGDFATDIMINFLSGISNNILVIISLIAIIGVGFSHLVRYMKSKKYHIPFSFIYVGLYEVIDIFFGLMILLSLGLAVPFLIIFSEDSYTLPTGIKIITTILSVVIVCIFSFIILDDKKEILYREAKKGSPQILDRNKKNKKKLNIIFFFKWIAMPVISIISIISFIDAIYYIDVLGGSSSNISLSFIAITFLYIFIVLMLALFYIILRVNELNHKKNSVVTINTTNYIIAFKHSRDEWILIPYIKDKGNVYFYKGEFIIKNIKNDNILVKEEHYNAIRPLLRLKQNAKKP